MVRYLLERRFLTGDSLYDYINRIISYFENKYGIKFIDLGTVDKLRKKRGYDEYYKYFTLIDFIDLNFLLTNDINLSESIDLNDEDILSKIKSKKDLTVFSHYYAKKPMIKFIFSDVVNKGEGGAELIRVELYRYRRDALPHKKTSMYAYDFVIDNIDEIGIIETLKRMDKFINRMVRSKPEFFDEYYSKLNEFINAGGQVEVTDEYLKEIDGYNVNNPKKKIKYTMIDNYHITEIAPAGLHFHKGIMRLSNYDSTPVDFKDAYDKLDDLIQYKNVMHDYEPEMDDSQIEYA